MSEKEKAFADSLSFEQWMRETIKSIHYADNQQMSDAYNRVMTNYLNS